MTEGGLWEGELERSQPLSCQLDPPCIKKTPGQDNGGVPLHRTDGAEEDPLSAGGGAMGKLLQSYSPCPVEGPSPD